MMPAMVSFSLVLEIFESASLAVLVPPSLHQRGNKDFFGAISGWRLCQVSGLNALHDSLIAVVTNLEMPAFLTSTNKLFLVLEITITTWRINFAHAEP